MSTGFQASTLKQVLMRGAANDLRNQAAAMGGNVLGVAGSPSSRACCPVLSRRYRDERPVYKCPN